MKPKIIPKPALYLCVSLLFIACGREGPPVEEPEDTSYLQRDGRSLRVASWNIACLRSGADEVFCNTSYSTGGHYIRTEAHIAALREHAARLAADVVFVQEVEGVEAVHQLFPGWQVQVVGGGDQRVGVAVSPSSEAIVSDVRAFDPLQVSWGLRPGLEATVTYQGEAVSTLAVHLKAGCPANALTSSSEDCQSLEEQSRVVADWIAAQEAGGTPYLLLGDFNRRMKPGDAFRARLEEAASSGLSWSTEDHEYRCWSHYARAPDYGGFIDHHIFSKSVEARWGAPRFEEHLFDEIYDDAWHYMSDHCPIILEFPYEGAEEG